MCRFKFSILQVIGMTTIVLAAFANSNFYVQQPSIINCYEGLTTQFTASGCSSSIISLSPSSTCVIAQAQNQKKVVALNNLKSVKGCDAIDEIFCCAQVIVDSTPCANQALLDFKDKNGITHIRQHAKIDAIYCHEAY